VTESLAAAAVDLGLHKMIGKLFTDNVASIRLVERCRFSKVGLASPARAARRRVAGRAVTGSRNSPTAGRGRIGRKPAG